ncbi:hypothetical protein [Pedobacter jejuensis]|uniref:Carboxypeptidase-like regulatory domain-containing protein n=1 Tax=Pedobacter jejuensis TaxID=1268550 RepID=A0A3N0BZK8_9SPHI|nr:hypothetical protein [Pedobacter jejuensis]RNL55172.1 hypothetical protein D7004_05665 [Pedobacter jejuensis]
MVNKLITGADGRFKLEKIPSISTVKIKKLGYDEYDLNLNSSLPDLNVYLQATSIDLNDVTILSKRDYVADSLKMRADNEQVFAYKAPTLEDVLVQKGWQYPTIGYNLVSNSTTSIVSLDVLKTVGLITKNKSSISKLQKVELNDEETTYVNRRFDAKKIAGITKLEGDSLKNFIKQYKPSATEVRKMNDYQILLYVKKSYREFIKPGEEN